MTARWSRLVAVFSAVVVLAGCGASREASLCEAKIRESLINPETLEFRDFAPASEAAVVAILEEKLKEELGAGSELPEGIAAAAAKDMLAKMKSEWPSAGLFQARVRAEGRLGNTVTQLNACFADSEKCDCVG